LLTRAPARETGTSPPPPNGGGAAPDRTRDGILPARTAPADRLLTIVALVILVLVPVAFNAITLWPEVSIPVPSLNDDAVHYLFIQRASEALARGENPFDHWVPDVELGFPMFFYYQHLPHLVVVFLHRLLFGRIDLLTLLNLVRYLLLVGLPLTVYWSMRRLEFSVVAAAVGAASASLLSANHRYGFEYDSYVWRGFGMYTQLWAMHLSFVTLACLHRLLARGEARLAAVLATATLALSHLVYAYMMALSALVLLLVGLNRTNARIRIGRLAVTGLLAAAITCYAWLPFLLLKAYLSASPYLQRWKYDSFGAAEILRWLVTGDLLDYGRLPVLTVLLALGLAAAVAAGSRQGRLAVALFGLWLVLYFGRVTWGGLVNLLPMHEGLLFHRFIGGVHLAAILLIGLGGEWIWQRLAPLPQHSRVLVAGAVVLLLLGPALEERQAFYTANRQWLTRTRVALDTDADARTVLATLGELPPGRVFAGLRADWGRTLRFGDLSFYNLLTFHQIPAVSPPYSGWSLNSDLIWHFAEANLAHYNLFNVRYVVAPASWSAPAFLAPIRTTPKYVLYGTRTSGYADFAAVTATKSVSSQLALFLDMRGWFLSPDPAAGRAVRYDYPSTTSSGIAAAEDAGAAAGAGCPAGRIGERGIGPGRLDLEVECPTAATVVLKMTYHPNWRVTVDGRPVPTFMVSPSFVGFEVPAGSHQVRAEYRSPAYKTVLLVLGAGVLLGTVFTRRRLGQLETSLSRASRGARAV
jgi:hypothetical protein